MLSAYQFPMMMNRFAAVERRRRTAALPRNERDRNFGLPHDATLGRSEKCRREMMLGLHHEEVAIAAQELLFADVDDLAALPRREALRPITRAPSENANALADRRRRFRINQDRQRRAVDERADDPSDSRLAHFLRGDVQQDQIGAPDPRL